jgi:hypothetical protein
VAVGFVSILAAQDMHSGSALGAPSGVKSAGSETLQLLHDQTLAVKRNTHYLDERERLSQMLLRLTQKTPQDPRQAKQLERAIRSDTRVLDRVQRNIDLSRLHLLATLPGKVGRVSYLLYKMQTLPPNDRRVAAFVAFTALRQQTVLSQLINILNQEEASAVLPADVADLSSFWRRVGPATRHDVRHHTKK